jgi:hypothetical protein
MIDEEIAEFFTLREKRQNEMDEEKESHFWKEKTKVIHRDNNEECHQTKAPKEGEITQGESIAISLRARRNLQTFSHTEQLMALMAMTE